MVSLISAITAQLKVVYQEKSFGSHVLEAEFLNEILTMPKICKKKWSCEDY